MMRDVKKYRKEYWIKNKNKLSEYHKKRYRKHNPIKIILCKKCETKFQKKTNSLYCKKCSCTKIRKRIFNQSAKGIYGTIKRRCKIKNIYFNLNQEEFIKWYKLNNKTCHYCTILKEELYILRKFFKNSSSKNILQRLTIDRKDNNKGYKIDNIVCACFMCNRTKSNIFSYEEFKKISEIFIKPKIKQLRGKNYEKSR